MGMREYGDSVSLCVCFDVQPGKLFQTPPATTFQHVVKAPLTNFLFYFPFFPFQQQADDTISVSEVRLIFVAIRLILDDFLNYTT